MNEYESYIETLRKANDLMQNIANDKTLMKRSKKRSFAESQILGKENYESLLEMTYRFEKMERILNGMLEHPETLTPTSKDDWRFIYSTFRHMYNWLSFLSQMTTYLLVISTYHNEQLVRSVAPKRYVVKYAKEFQRFTAKQEKILNNIRNHRPLFNEDDQLKKWFERAIDDSKKEKVF